MTAIAHTQSRSSCTEALKQAIKPHVVTAAVAIIGSGSALYWFGPETMTAKVVLTLATTGVVATTSMLHDQLQKRPGIQRTAAIASLSLNYLSSRLCPKLTPAPDFGTVLVAMGALKQQNGDIVFSAATAEAIRQSIQNLNQHQPGNTDKLN
jgi:hypothetical protein